MESENDFILFKNYEDKINKLNTIIKKLEFQDQNDY